MYFLNSLWRRSLKTADSFSKSISPSLQNLTLKPKSIGHCCHHCCSLPNVTAPPTLLSMVGCCVVCCSSPAALSAIQICQPPPLCGRPCRRWLLMPPLTAAIATATVDEDDHQKQAVVVRHQRQQWRSWSTAVAVDGGGGDNVFATVVNDYDRMVANRPSLPPPRPCPCIRCHHRCSLHQRHRPSNAPVDCWLLCHLLPLTCYVVRRPNLSASAIVWSSMLLPLGRRPLLLTITSRCPVALLPSINHIHRSIKGWLLRSPPAQQHTDHITKLKTFPVSTSWTYFDLLRVNTCERMLNLRRCQFFLSSYDVTTSSLLIPTYM